MQIRSQIYITVRITVRKVIYTCIIFPDIDAAAFINFEPR